MMKQNQLKKLFCIFSFLLLSSLLFLPTAHAGQQNCTGDLCSRQYWTDEQRAAVEQRGFGGYWNALGEREREMFPNFYRAGGWAMENIVAPAAQVALGPWMQRNFWTPLEQTPPDLGPSPFEVDSLVAMGMIGVGKWGKAMRPALELTGNVLGKGSASTVYEATMEGSTVAVKVSTHAVNATERDLRRMIIAEAKMARTLAREGIGGVEYHGLTRVEGRLGIVTNKVPQVAIEKGDVLSALSEAEYQLVRQNSERLAGRLSEMGYAIGDYQFGVTTEGELLLYDLEGIRSFGEGLLLPSEATVPGAVHFLLRRMDEARRIGLIRKAGGP